jgi:UvrD/REP helicase N-terminal domain
LIPSTEKLAQHPRVATDVVSHRLHVRPANREQSELFVRAVLLHLTSAVLQLVHRPPRVAEVLTRQRASAFAPVLLEKYPELSEAQRAIIGHINGPLLVVAGPGSGKTFSIVLRALNLLLLSQFEPGNLVLCTFTEKSAFELRDRIAAAAQNVGYSGDLPNSLCQRFMVGATVC